jgi:hypothetical protein
MKRDPQTTQSPDSRVVKAGSPDRIRKPQASSERTHRRNTAVASSTTTTTTTTTTQRVEVRDGGVGIGGRRARRPALDGDQHVGAGPRRRGRGGRHLVRDLGRGRRGHPRGCRTLPPAARWGRGRPSLRGHW